METPPPLWRGEPGKGNRTAPPYKPHSIERKEKIMATASISKIKLLTRTAEGRPCDPNEIARQIGKLTIMAISGGRAYAITNDDGENVGLRLPCGPNRCVDIVLDWDDTYRVTQYRIIAKGLNKGFVVTEYQNFGIYCDQISEESYQAAMRRYA